MSTAKAYEPTPEEYAEYEAYMKEEREKQSANQRLQEGKTHWYRADERNPDRDIPVVITRVERGATHVRQLGENASFHALPDLILHELSPRELRRANHQLEPIA